MLKTSFYLFSLFSLSLLCQAQIEPTWESMAKNYQVPEWFQDGKIGVWMHWGIPSAIDKDRPHDGSHYGSWMYGAEDQLTAAIKHPQAVQKLTDWHNQRYGHYSEFGYEKFIPHFKAEKWNPDGLVKFFKENGARFIMPVAVHHDNFDMYESSHPWNSVAMGPKRDTIQEWKDAARKHNLKFGVSTHLYWSPKFFNSARKHQKPGTPEWKLFNMDYPSKGYASDQAWNQHWYERCWELIDKYDPDMFNNDSPYPTVESGKGLGVKLFSSFLNRDLKENNGKQTTVLSFKNAKMNRAAFTYNLEQGMSSQIQDHSWMWATDLAGLWFYREGSRVRFTAEVLIANTVDVVSKNGTAMLNVGMRGDGTLPEKQAAILQKLGNWLKINGEGIYGTRPWNVFGEGPKKIKDGNYGVNSTAYSPQDIRFTKKGTNLYAFVLETPKQAIIIKTLANGGIYKNEIASISLLGSTEKLKWSRSDAGLTIDLPKTLPKQAVVGFRISSK